MPVGVSACLVRLHCTVLKLGGGYPGAAASFREVVQQSPEVGEEEHPPHVRPEDSRQLAGRRPHEGTEASGEGQAVAAERPEQQGAEQTLPLVPRAVVQARVEQSGEGTAEEHIGPDAIAGHVQ